MNALWAVLGACLLRLRLLAWRIVYRGYARRYRISPTFRFNGAGIEMFGEGRIELGDDSYVGEFSSLQASAGYSISIGRRCKISHNVRIYTMTAEAESDFRIHDGKAIYGNVNIGDGVWIGVNVFIGPGINIGSNSVIGANSVVTKDVPADEIWGGVPARHLRSKVARAGNLQHGATMSDHGVAS